MTKVSQKQKRYVKNLTKYLGVVQAHFRKALALWEMPHIEGKSEQVIEVLKLAVEQDPDNSELAKMLEQAIQEL